MKLSDLQVGETARITGIDADQSIGQRLMALGLLVSETVTLLRMAPLGDPITVECLGIQVSLRRADAAVVTVER